DRREGERISRAQRLLNDVSVPDEVLADLCTRCAREGADGLRADLTIYKAASALAAYEGRTVVSGADVDAVAELALAHRRTTPAAPPDPPPPAPGNDQPPPERPAIPPREEYYARREKPGESRASAGSQPPEKDEEQEFIAASAPTAPPRWVPRGPRR